ncbi:MAG TPA: prolipoprotein diacylglyceryl transferase [Acidimicrobiales bacterium]|nr:prolipoprotein diacylglyceryl transferase [Acidimicrobiales bacterium]
MLASFPSPPTNGLSVGPLRLHAYGLLIAAGVVAAVWLSQRRYSAIGGRAGTIAALAVWGVPGGLVGARVYSLVTSWQIDTQGSWLRAFEIWHGGLGIWGGITVGVFTGWLGVRRMGLRLLPLLDCVAPGLVLAQAIGRWGNYVNQELYGRATSLPWAVYIDHPVCPPRYAAQCVGHTFQPTFLYESLWDLAVCGLLILAERRLRIRRGWLIALYAALYTVGRFFTEYLRIDPAHKYGPFRINDWVSIAVFLVAGGLFVVRGLGRPGDELAGDPLTTEGADQEARPLGVHGD